MNKHKGDSLNTYGMVVGMVNSGISLGNTLGPTIGGAITDALDYSWTMTIISFATLLMVSVHVCLLTYNNVAKFKMPIFNGIYPYITAVW